MATKDKNKEVAAEVAAVAPVETVETPKAAPKADPRLALWREHVENYKKDNPAKAAAKEANGEFKAPPASFKGIKKELELANGGTRVLIY